MATDARSPAASTHRVRRLIVLARPEARLGARARCNSAPAAGGRCQATHRVLRAMLAEGLVESAGGLAGRTRARGRRPAPMPRAGGISPSRRSDARCCAPRPGASRRWSKNPAPGQFCGGPANLDALYRVLLHARSTLRRDDFGAAMTGLLDHRRQWPGVVAIARLWIAAAIDACWHGGGDRFGRPLSSPPARSTIPGITYLERSGRRSRRTSATAPGGCGWPCPPRRVLTLCARHWRRDSDLQRRERRL